MVYSIVLQLRTARISYVKCERDTIHAMFIPVTGSNPVGHFHKNFGNIWHRADKLNLIGFIMDLRAYVQSIEKNILISKKGDDR